jgi:hypothetical protein
MIKEEEETFEYSDGETIQIKRAKKKSIYHEDSSSSSSSDDDQFEGGEEIDLGYD